LLPAINHDAYRSTPQAVIPQDQASLAEPLTAREMEVLELLAGRLSAKEIANRLFISDRTVKRHAANIYQKLGVHSRNEAIEVARMQDILLRG
ncbi:MAG: helix-turn-helix transcriptional regulator, partial [Anaerolineae bacterium]|nr:helix-turn-helix transcriptional regulator [Anaerolineae bacterium]